jgi:hypothetical protein
VPIALLLALGVAVAGAAPQKPAAGAAEEDRLIVHWARGAEHFALERATWNTYQEEGRAFATFLVRTSRVLKTRNEAGGNHPLPFWELTAMRSGLTPIAITPGTTLSIPSGYDEDAEEYVVDFYYHEHEQSDDNRIEILQVEGTRVKVRITGKDTTAGARIEVTTWFERDPKLERSSI